jgi:hypothetical protein
MLPQLRPGYRRPSSRHQAIVRSSKGAHALSPCHSCEAAQPRSENPSREPQAHREAIEREGCHRHPSRNTVTGGDAARCLRLRSWAAPNSLDSCCARMTGRGRARMTGGRREQ